MNRANSRARVLLVLHDLGPVGGSERACTELIRRGLQEFDFTVLSNTLSEELRSVVDWCQIPVVHRPFPLKFVSFYLTAGLRVARQRANIVHSMGAIVPNRVDLASVHHCHAGFRRGTGRLAPMEAPLFRRINTSIGRLLSILAERWSYRPSRTRALAAVSSGVARELAEQYPRVTIRVTPNGVDSGRFAPSVPIRTGFRRSAGVAPDEIVTLFVGGDWPLKGLAPAIGGVALASHALDTKLQLWVVGRGNTGRFRELARRFGIADQIHFFGPQPRVEHFYQSADILILPSLYETFSLVAFEAAACGLPVIGTRVSGIEELIGENEAGLLVERAAASIAVALQRLVRDPRERRQMGEAARRRVAQFTWERSADEVLNLYRELLTNKQPVRQAAELIYQDKESPTVAR